MKIKRFNESNIDEPKVGDYVICKDRRTLKLSDKIGKIIDKYSSYSTYSGNNTTIYKVSNEMFKGYFTCFFEDFLYWAKTKEELEEELEMRVQAKKYNL